jgi:hypothetical protein
LLLARGDCLRRPLPAPACDAKESPCRHVGYVCADAAYMEPRAFDEARNEGPFFFVCRVSRYFISSGPARGAGIAHPYARRAMPMSITPKFMKLRGMEVPKRGARGGKKDEGRNVLLSSTTRHHKRRLSLRRGSGDAPHGQLEAVAATTLLGGRHGGGARRERKGGERRRKRKRWCGRREVVSVAESSLTPSFSLGVVPPRTACPAEHELSEVCPCVAGCPVRAYSPSK